MRFRRAWLSSRCVPGALSFPSCSFRAPSVPFRNDTGDVCSPALASFHAGAFGESSTASERYRKQGSSLRQQSFLGCQLVPDFTSQSDPDCRFNPWWACLSTAQPHVLVFLESQLWEDAGSPLLLARPPESRVRWRPPSWARSL